jgi:predicted RecB family nuclease
MFRLRLRVSHTLAVEVNLMRSHAARADLLNQPRHLPVVGQALGPRLSKSRFVSGLQCHRRLWWTVHDPDAVELVPDEGLRAVFERGHQVGDAARKHVPGGVLIDFEPGRASEAIDATARALAGGARVIYEACFSHDGVFVAVDVLERRPDGFVLIEVKSTLSVKPQHVVDAAIQTWVLRKQGLRIARTEIMHLNRDCRVPDLSDLFERVDVSAEVEAFQASIEPELQAQRTMLTGCVPPVSVGEHCNRPYACPFVNRCWPRLPSDHISELYYLSPERVVELEARGYRTIRQVPDYVQLNPVAARQRRAVQAREVVVEPGLKDALANIDGELAFLDFETIMPAIPRWDGCGPYQTTPVQFSVHALRGGRVEHVSWLAEGPEDPRPGLAKALLSATAGAKYVLAYHAPFEEQQIASLARAVPELSEELLALAERLVDLLPIVRRHVYHPNFHGGFGLKKVLPALVPELGYDDLNIADGLAACHTLEALLLRSESFDDETKAKLRRDLSRYCERDTLALVKLLTRLRHLAS